MKRIVRSFLTIAALGAGLACASGYLPSGQVMAAPPLCREPGEAPPPVFGRCLNKGYFTGQARTDRVPAIAPNGSTYTYAPILFPLENKFAYTETWAPNKYWAFPAVQTPGRYTFGGTVIDYPGGPSVRNANYARLFIAQQKDYLFADFSSGGPNRCIDGAPYVPPARQFAPAGYNPGPQARNLNYMLNLYDDPQKISSGSTCFNLRRNAVGAATLIASMYGKSGTDFGSSQAGIAYAKSVISGWEQLVLEYDARGWANWNANTVAGPGHLNTTGINYGRDNIWFTWTAGSYNVNAIVFHDPSDPQNVYEINRQCANLIGVDEGLPGFDLYPRVSVSPSTVEQGETATFQFNVDNRGYAASPSVQYRTTYTVSAGPAIGAGPGGSRGFGVGSTLLGSRGVNTSSYAVGTQICANLTVGPPVAYDQNVSRSARSCVIVVARPYFDARGGDISAGAGMGHPANGSDCSTSPAKPNSNAGIVSWNRGPTGAFGGAGTNYGILALGSIQGVATGQTGAYAPDGLAFANATAAGNPSWTGGSADGYGGRAGSLGCAPEYFQPTLAIRNSEYKLNPGSPTRLANGERPDTLYVDGNVFIDNDVIFTSAGAYASATTIPRFSIVVRGNIYIAPTVTRLDGVYVAEPRANGTGGIIYTCAPQGVATDAASVLNRSLFQNCGKQLTFNGAVSARQVWLLRTYGSRLTEPAERFNFTPESWLGSPFSSTSAAGPYEALTSLPPVL